MQTIQIDVKDIYIDNVLNMLHSLQDIMIDNIKLYSTKDKAYREKL